ncbi:RNA polymerase sigma factor SigJ [Zavarzinella formosa]|uniref:RNA polymerase sigma factor SigJ n=1 Tax=Zavarzinella formosa TaxID=360055 RepID=UPI0003048D72|nr:RNA polymerase sigma factor SigJ [Zavarzinella formosa]
MGSDIDHLRPKLLAVAYRMLGLVADAEDAVQEAYLRFHQTNSIASPEGWLVRTVTRLCIDKLRQTRRETYAGPWLPEPVSEAWDGAAADRLELAESLSMAFLVLLETLSPTERAAYLLREVFGYEFGEIAGLLDKTPVAVRQLTTRAKKRLGRRERRFEPNASDADGLAERFYAACQSGDVTAIEAMLTEDVAYYSDGGGQVPAAPKPVLGRHRVANLLAVRFRKLREVCDLTFTTVNGQPGVVFSTDGIPVQIYSFNAENGSVRALYAMLNPEKLRRWP